MSNLETHEPRLLTSYLRYLDDQNTVAFVMSVKREYRPGTLERLVKRPESPEIRQAAVFALGFVGDFEVNPTVGRAMNDSDSTVRQLAQISSRKVWNRSGDADQQKQLVEIVRLNASGDHRSAINRVTDLLNEAPWFAEAWYHRGSAWFELKHFGRAQSYLHQALELNPYHFVAAITMGDALLKLSDPSSALECYQRALRLTPDLPSLQEKVATLSREFDPE